MAEVFYLKDTGYANTDMSGEQDSWLVNAGYPVRMYVTSFSINSKANYFKSRIVNDLYFPVERVSKEFTSLKLNCEFSTDFTITGTLYFYNTETNEYDTYQDPSVSSVIALLEQALKKNSHFDLYMSNGSGVTPTKFKTLPLYWLALTKSNYSNSTTSETHLNVKLEDYTVKTASAKKIVVDLTFTVLE